MGSRCVSHVAIACACALAAQALSGCATTLSQDDAQFVREHKAAVVVTGPTPDFEKRKAGQDGGGFVGPMVGDPLGLLLLVPLVVGAGVKAARDADLNRRSGIDQFPAGEEAVLRLELHEPATSVQREFVEHVGNRFTAGVVESAIAGSVEEATETWANGPPMSLVTFRTKAWGIQPVPSAATNYAVAYEAEIRIVRTDQRRVLYRNGCRIDGSSFPLLWGTPGTLAIRRDLDSKLQRAAAMCGRELARHLARQLGAPDTEDWGDLRSGDSSGALETVPTSNGTSLSQDQIGEVVRGQGARIDACMADERARNPAFAGAFGMAWTIRPDGRPAAARPARDEDQGSKLFQCLGAVVSGMRFPRFSGAEAVEVTYLFDR